jgi:hypothetical protein
MIGRGIRMPKRLVDAWLGALVARTLPDAVLWASTYRDADGIGIDVRPELLLLQCSPADTRDAGPSTRVNRATLSVYAHGEHLWAWGRQAQFVLVGAIPTSGARPTAGPELWCIAACDLAEVVESRGRGTIDAVTLENLVSSGHARSMPELLRHWVACARSVGPALDARTREPPIHAHTGRHDHEHQFARYGLFGMNVPTPVGVALAPHLWRNPPNQ